MTAEVAVLNRIGVALAADSAVTLGGGANKVYTSADKLFQLSHEAPVGIMVYGNANFVGMPWETIIKAYRGRLGLTRFDKIEDYAQNFISYLTNNPDLFPQSLQQRQVETLVGSLFYALREAIHQRLDEETRKKNGLDDADIPPLVGGVLDNRLAFIRTAPLIDGFPHDHGDKARQEFSPCIDRIRQQVFGNLPMLPESSRVLEDIAIEMLTRVYFGPLQCGVVVAGFGEKEYVPSLVVYELEEATLGLPRRRVQQRFTIHEPSDACIIPFAQKDCVDLFLRGIDEGVAKFMQDTTERLVTGAIDLVLNKMAVVNQPVADQIRAAVQPEVTTLLASLAQEWSGRQQKYWQPVLNIVAALPKDELAAMSEALVNLTKFRRRVTPERETVGGPIDVGVITKGDGFVWLRRKHYFDPALNPRVMARYLKG